MSLSSQDALYTAGGGAVGAAAGYLAKGKLGAAVGAAAGAALGYAFSKLQSQGFQLSQTPTKLAGTSTTPLQNTDVAIEQALQGVPVVGNTLAQNLVVNPYNAGFAIGQSIRNNPFGIGSPLNGTPIPSIPYATPKVLPTSSNPRSIYAYSGYK